MDKLLKLLENDSTLTAEQLSVMLENKTVYMFVIE